MGFSKQPFFSPFSKVIFPVLSVLALSSILACAGSSDPAAQASLAANVEKFAVIATTDYTGSASHAIIGLDQPRTALLDPQPSRDSKDVTITCNGKYIYRIERRNFGANGSVVKFSLDDPKQVIYDYSADDADPSSSSNPIDIAFVNQNKAYLLRNMNNKIWIINPSAQNEAEFKIGEIDLSAYSPDHGVTPPAMSKGLIIGNRLFILLQRLDAFYSPSVASYIAVFNTDTDQEIDTGYGEAGLKGVKLDIRNPYGRLIYNNGTIYVAGTIFPDNPAWFSTTWTDYKNYSGIQRINAATLEPDHNIIHKAVSTITYLSVASPDKGYFVEYIGAGNTRLRSFNPTTGVVSASVIAGIGDSGDRDISDIALDSENKLWIADFSIANMGMYVLNTADDTIEDGPISTGLNPVAISFCER